MGDTEKGSWTSRELGRHINEEQARAVERVGHTPGPWEVGPYNNVHDTDTGESVAVVTDRHGEEANARLIAAAPDLLRQLQIANTNISLIHSDRQAHTTCASGVDTCSCPLAKNWRRNKEAIAKATGGQS